MYLVNLYYLEIDEGIAEVVKSDVDTKLKEIFKTEDEDKGKYTVILYNDDLNSAEYVTGIIQDVFGYTELKSLWLMMKVHFMGKGKLWIGPKKEAVEYQNKIIAFGPDPSRIEAGAKALKVSVDRVPE